MESDQEHYTSRMNADLNHLSNLVYSNFITQAEERKIKRKIKKYWKPVIDKFKTGEWK